MFKFFSILFFSPLSFFFSTFDIFVLYYVLRFIFSYFYFALFCISIIFLREFDVLFFYIIFVFFFLFHFFLSFISLFPLFCIFWPHLIQSHHSCCHRFLNQWSIRALRAVHLITQQIISPTHPQLLILYTSTRPRFFVLVGDIYKRAVLPMTSPDHVGCRLRMTRWWNK